MAAFTDLVGWALIAFIVYRWTSYRQITNKIKDWPGIRSWRLPSLGSVNMPEHLISTWREEGALPAKFNRTIYSCVSYLSNRCAFYIADARALKIITTDLRTFQKPQQIYKLLNFFGPHIISLEGDDWRRHRKISSPAFSESINNRVWVGAQKIVEEFAATHESEAIFSIDAASVAEEMALVLISSAAFGQTAGWRTDTIAPAGFDLTLWESLRGVLDSIVLRVALPRWAYYFPYWPSKWKSRIAAVEKAFVETTKHMHRFVVSKSELEKEAPDSLIVLLLKAASDDLGQDLTLSLDEVFGNMFAFLFAGHDTSAHTTAQTLVLLALYPEIQDWVREEIVEVADGRSSFDYSDFSRLTRTMAAVNETLRLYPQVPTLPRWAAEDAFLPSQTVNTTAKPETFQAFIPKGSLVFLDISGLQRNPTLWGSDANEFKPSRFIDTQDYQWPRDGFLAFSQGARNCLGKRLANVEMAAVISKMLLMYRLQLPRLQLDLLAAGMPRQEVQANIMKSSFGFTMRPETADIDLVRLK